MFELPFPMRSITALECLRNDGKINDATLNAQICCNFFHIRFCFVRRNLYKTFNIVESNGNPLGRILVFCNCLSS